MMAVCAAVAMLASGCSPEVAFPAIHDMPPPRSDAPLTPDQVKQATDGLISDRNHLSTETQAAVAATAAADAPLPASTARAGDGGKKEENDEGAGKGPGEGNRTGRRRGTGDGRWRQTLSQPNRRETSPDDKDSHDVTVVLNNQPYSP
jgi:hypothetical protein